MKGTLPVVVMVFILAHGICLLLPQTEHEQQQKGTPSHQQDTERQLHKGTHANFERHDKNNLKTFMNAKKHAQSSNILNDVINFQENVGSHDTDENTREDPSVFADSTSITESGGANTVGQQNSKSDTKMPSDPDAGRNVRKLEGEKIEKRNDQVLAVEDINTEESKRRVISSMQSSPYTDKYHRSTVKLDHDNSSISQRSTNLPSLEALVRGGQFITESPLTVNQHHPDITTSRITEPNLYEEDDTDLTNNARVVQTVHYDYPTDYHACGSCKCHHIGRGSKSNIYADCSHNDFNNIFPKKIPSNAVTLDVSQTHFHLTTFEGFTVYPSLTTLILKFNEINNLRNVSCGLKEMLQITSLNIYHNRISNIDDNSFECLPHLVNLDLSYNLLKKILTRTLWGVPQLTYLDLGYNKIIHIEEGAFDIHNKLTHLLLTANSLLSYDSLSPRLFYFLTSVTILRIAHFKRNETFYPNAALQKFKSLQALDVDGMNDVQFGPDLRSLTNLHTLRVMCRPFAETRQISANYLQYTPYLTYLRINQCHLTELSYKVYKWVPFLTNLTFRIVYFPFDQFFDHLVGLENSEVINLGAISIADDDPNPCRCLSKRHSKHIQNMRKLQELYLVGNRITFIGADFVADLPPSIRKIDLARNLLVQYRSILPLCANLPSLVSLTEDRQNRISYWRGKKGGFQTETCGSPSLVLPTNHLTNNQNYSNRTLDLREVTESNVYSNEHIFLRNTTFLNITTYSAAESFKFGDYFLLSKLDKIYRTRILNVSNVFNGGLGARNISRWVEIIDLSNNSCDSLSNDFFHVNNSLVELHLRNNFLGYELFKDVDGLKFSRLSNVQFIDISTNYLQVLPYLIFKGLYKARIINLSNNNIRNVDIYLVHMTNLMFVDLSRNDINWISRKTRNDLDTLALKHKVSIDLTSNPLPCTCTGIELLQWLLTTNVQILNRDFLECVNMQKKTELIGNLKLKVASLKRSCVSTTFVMTATSAAIFVILVITSAVLLFRNRWRLHYLRNIIITKYFGFKARGTDDPNDPNYTFDAYILYSEEDREFVLGEVLQELEQKRGHRLCVEDRDFIPGTFAPCNITSAVSSSRVTIPVISPDFWEDDWSEYGLQMAVMESIHAKRNVLHLLLYKHVPVEDMSRDLIKVHKDNRFSEYPPENCSEDVKEAFWDAMSHAIGHTNNPDGHLVLEH